MNFRENQLSKDLLSQFELLVLEYNIYSYDYSLDTRIKNDDKRNYVIDLIILISGYELYFEIKNRSNSKSDDFESLAFQFAKPNRFFIVYSGNGHFEIKPSNYFREPENFDNIFNFYRFIVQISRRPRPDNILLREIFKAAVESIQFEGEKTEKLDKIQSLLKNGTFITDLKFDEMNNHYYFTNDILETENFENKFFDCLLEDLNVGELFYRYGDLKLAFHTVQDRCCKFSGIPGMNDISEVGYVDHYLDHNYVPLKTKRQVAEINKKFILCSSQLKDDLTQWRLYGDDCKGTSLEFEVRGKSDKFIIKKISYGIEQQGENFHFELDLIKFIQDEFYSITGSVLKFRMLDIWKHFFKSFEYSIEKEVRVLYIENDITNQNIKWNLTYTHNILNPFITFNFAKLPIKVNKVFFGSKCSENEINLKQFEHYAEVQNLNLKFELSRIKNYR